VSHSVDETYDLYSEKFPRARKEHTCGACAETIMGGQRYARVFILHDGNASEVVRCLRCQKLHEHLRDLGDGDTWPAERLDCGETYQQHWGELPEDIAALAFALPGEVK
jgi:hypothetical protein